MFQTIATDENETPEYNGFASREQGLAPMPKTHLNYLPLLYAKPAYPSTILTSRMKAKKFNPLGTAARPVTGACTGESHGSRTAGPAVTRACDGKSTADTLGALSSKLGGLGHLLDAHMMATLEGSQQAVEKYI